MTHAAAVQDTLASEVGHDMRRLVFQQTKTNGLPDAYIGVVFGVNVSIHGSPMECMGMGEKVRARTSRRFSYTSVHPHVIPCLKSFRHGKMGVD